MDGGILKNIKLNKMQASKMSALIADFLTVSKNSFGMGREINQDQGCKLLVEATGRIIAFN